jgi:hypothetical protein
VVSHTGGSAITMGSVRVERVVPIVPGILSWWSCVGGPWPAERGQAHRQAHELHMTLELSHGEIRTVTVPVR